MIDRFDDISEVSNKWEIFGGQLGTGCGNLSLGNSLYFGKTGYRIAQTVDIDTTNLKQDLKNFNFTFLLNNSEFKKVYGKIICIHKKII